MNEYRPGHMLHTIKTTSPIESITLLSWHNLRMGIPIYLINLEDRKDRLLQSAEIAKKFDFEFCRIDAVSKSLLLEKDFKFASPEVVAAFRSHQKAFKCFLDSENEYALILEDDFKPRKRFSIPDSKFLENLNVDVLQLGFLHTSKIESLNILFVGTRSISLRFFRLFFKRTSFGAEVINRKKLLSELDGIPWGIVPSDFRPGAHSYIASRHAAKTLLEINSPVALSIDELLKSLSVMRTLRIKRFMFSQVAQSNSPSSIIQRNLLE